jgi:hypothetical protein
VGDPLGETLRPRELALLLLASGDLRPRQRARDQQADEAGLRLKAQLLDRLVVLDPEPARLDEALARVIEEIGPPSGPTRALALTFREEWQTACSSPEWVEHLLGEAVRAGRREAEGKRRGP